MPWIIFFLIADFVALLSFFSRVVFLYLFVCAAFVFVFAYRVDLHTYLNTHSIHISYTNSYTYDPVLCELFDSSLEFVKLILLTTLSLLFSSISHFENEF